MHLPALAVIAIVELHTPNGHAFDLNADEISSLRDPVDIPGHWARGTHCIVVMTNGRTNGVQETCDAVAEKWRTK
jgi:uncharacterized protein YlzI (FlbEa/FlbD family)